MILQMILHCGIENFQMIPYLERITLAAPLLNGFLICRNSRGSTLAALNEENTERLMRYLKLEFGLHNDRSIFTITRVLCYHLYKKGCYQLAQNGVCLYSIRKSRNERRYWSEAYGMKLQKLINDFKNINTKCANRVSYFEAFDQTGNLDDGLQIETTAEIKESFDAVLVNRNKTRETVIDLEQAESRRIVAPESSVTQIGSTRSLFNNEVATNPWLHPKQKRRKRK